MKGSLFQKHEAVLHLIYNVLVQRVYVNLHAGIKPRISSISIIVQIDIREHLFFYLDSSCIPYCYLIFYRRRPA